MKILHSWCESPKHFLFVMGSPGCGKTYMAAAMVEWMYGKFPSFRIWNDQHLLETLRTFISSEVRGDFLRQVEYLVDDEFLIIDDLGSSHLTQWQVSVWFHVINTQYQNESPTVITTNLTEAQILEELGERIHSRIFSAQNTILNMHSYTDLRQKGL